MSTALILIDIQKDYFPGGRMELIESTEAAGAAARLLSAFRKASWPVYHVQHISVHPTATFFLPDSTGIDINPNVAPLPDETVVIKHYPNSFRETNLLELLKADGIVVCADSNESDVWIEDCSIAAIIIQLTALSLGLGSCWAQIRNRQHDYEKTAEAYVKELLCLPEQMQVECILGISMSIQ
jgi:hypothetical protein